MDIIILYKPSLRKPLDSLKYDVSLLKRRRYYHYKGQPESEELLREVSISQIASSIGCSQNAT
jgi:hypothetical protein